MSNKDAIVEILENKSRFKGLFLLLLRCDTYRNSESFAKNLAVSSRTIKSDMSELKKALQPFQVFIKAKPSHGYKLEIPDKLFAAELKEYFQLYQLSTINNEFDTRTQTILRRLLTASKPVKVEDLQKELYLNLSNSLSKELTQIKKILNDYSLTLTTKPYQGITIRGQEYHKVLLTVRMYKYFNTTRNIVFNVPEFDDLFSCSIKAEIRTLFITTITQTRLVFPDIYADRFIIYLIYFYNRTQNDDLTLEYPSLDFNVYQTDEYQFVQTLLNTLSVYDRSFLFSEEVVIFLTYIAIMSTDLYQFKDCSYEKYHNLYVKSKTMHDFILRKMSTYLQVDFFSDATCVKDLLKLMIPLSIKWELHVSDDIDFGFYHQENSNSQHILYQSLDRLTADFYTMFQIRLSKREYYLILKCFSAVLNRISLHHKKLKLAIIAVNGRLSTQQLKFNLQHYFSEHIETIDIKVLYELEMMKQVHYDYYLCNDYGKYMHIPYRPIYYAAENIAEDEYRHSLQEVFYEALGYDVLLPPLELQFLVKPLSIMYEDCVLIKDKALKIYYNFQASRERIKVFYYPESKHQTSTGMASFIVIQLNIAGNFKKLKMILKVVDKMLNYQEAFLNLCVTKTCNYKNIMMLSSDSE